MNKNPYDVLGVSPEATDDEIKKAYRELSRKYHPDANVDNPLKDLAEEKFKEVQEAYDTIVKERENGGGYHYGYGNAGSYTTGSGSYGNSGYGGAGSTTISQIRTVAVMVLRGLAVPEMFAVISGLRILCVNVWEAIFAHACKNAETGICRPDACSDHCVPVSGQYHRKQYAVPSCRGIIFRWNCISGGRSEDELGILCGRTHSWLFGDTE